MYPLVLYNHDREREKKDNTHFDNVHHKSWQYGQCMQKRGRLQTMTPANSSDKKGLCVLW